MPFILTFAAAQQMMAEGTVPESYAFYSQNRAGARVLSPSAHLVRDGDAIVLRYKPRGADPVDLVRYEPNGSLLLTPPPRRTQVAFDALNCGPFELTTHVNTWSFRKRGWTHVEDRSIYDYTTRRYTTVPTTLDRWHPILGPLRIEGDSVWTLGGEEAPIATTSWISSRHQVRNNMDTYVQRYKRYLVVGRYIRSDTLVGQAALYFHSALPDGRLLAEAVGTEAFNTLYYEYGTPISLVGRAVQTRVGARRTSLTEILTTYGVENGALQAMPRDRARMLTHAVRQFCQESTGFEVR